MYVINVDLWSEEGDHEVNLIRHSGTAPSISATTSVPFSAMYENSASPQSQHMLHGPLSSSLPSYVGMGQGRDSDLYQQQQSRSMSRSSLTPSHMAPPSYHHQHQHHHQHQNQQQLPSHPGDQQQISPEHVSRHTSGPDSQAMPPPPLPSSHYLGGHILIRGVSMITANSFNAVDTCPASQSPYGTPSYTPATQYFAGGIPTPTRGYALPRGTTTVRYAIADSQPPPSRSSASDSPSGHSGMFSRNLIGSLAASAFRLEDAEKRIGIWFVMQDLSVRTEGIFRYGDLLASRTGLYLIYSIR